MKNFAELVAEQIAADRAEFGRLRSEGSEPVAILDAVVQYAVADLKQKTPAQRREKLEKLVREAAACQVAAEDSGLLDD